MSVLYSIQYVIEANDAAQKDADSRTKKAGYTKGDVNSGLGKWVGGLATGTAAPAGMIAGHYASKALTKDPKKPADLKSRGNRAAIIYDKQNSMKQVKSGGKGAALGAGLGAVAGSMSDHPNALKAGTAIGAIGGAAVGYTGSAIKAGYKHAKKMGYGKFGRVGVAGGGAAAALTTPKSQSDAKVGEKAVAKHKRQLAHA